MKQLGLPRHACLVGSSRDDDAGFDPPTPLYAHPTHSRSIARLRLSNLSSADMVPLGHRNAQRKASGDLGRSNLRVIPRRYLHAQLDGLRCLHHRQRMGYLVERKTR